jgi:hypothetical protein
MALACGGAATSRNLRMNAHGQILRSRAADAEDRGTAREGRRLAVSGAAQHVNRIAELLPVQYARMKADPFAFLRGAAAIMAADLAAAPPTPSSTRLACACAAPRSRRSGSSRRWHNPLDRALGCRRTRPSLALLATAGLPIGRHGPGQPASSYSWAKPRRARAQQISGRQAGVAGIWVQLSTREARWALVAGIGSLRPL